MSSGEQQAASASHSVEPKVVESKVEAGIVSHTAAPAKHEKESPPPEIGGRGGLEPTRYGDWEKNGRCIDF
jgi:hypothetical protein